MNLTALPFGELLDRIGEKSPTPGGGAVAAAVGTLAAALGRMVVSYSEGKKDLAEHEPALRDAAATLERARWMLLELAAEDMAAYDALNAAMKMPKDAPGRAERIAALALDALRPPMAMLAACVELLRLFDSLTTRSNRHLRSDLAIAAVLAESAARASSWNVSVNTPLLAAAGEHEARMREMLAHASVLLARIERACASPAKPEPGRPSGR